MLISPQPATAMSYSHVRSVGGYVPKGCRAPVIVSKALAKPTTISGIPTPKRYGKSYRTGLLFKFC